MWQTNNHLNVFPIKVWIFTNFFYPFVSYHCRNYHRKCIIFFFLDANMTSDPRECNRCGRKTDKDELFYHYRHDDYIDYCTTCFDIQKQFETIFPERYQLMVYCLPPGIRIRIYKNALIISDWNTQWMSLIMFFSLCLFQTNPTLHRK